MLSKLYGEGKKYDRFGRARLFEGRGVRSFLVNRRAGKVARNVFGNTVAVIPARFVPAFKPASKFVTDVEKRNEKYHEI